MLHNRLKVLNEEQAERFNAAALRVLQNVGMKVLNERILQVCDQFGWQVDFGQGVVRFQPELVRECTETDRQRGGGTAAGVAWTGTGGTAGEAASAPPEAPWAPKTFGVGYGEACFFLYDWREKKQVAAGRQELIDMIRLGDAIPEVTSLSIPFVNQQIDQRIEAIEACELLLAYTSKPAWGGIRLAVQVPYFMEIAQIVEEHTREKERFLQTGGCLTSPLCLGQRTAEIVEAFHDRGFRRFGFSSMPVAGANAPVTVEGTVVLSVAELLGGWMIAKALAGGQAEPVPGMIISGVMDMKTGRACFGAPEACLQDLAVNDTLRMCYGRPAELDAAAGYVEARVPGMMAAFEKCFKQTTYGAADGVGLHIGTLDCGKAFSPTQAMVELDMNEWYWRFFRGLSVSPETLAVELIEEIGCGESKTYLDHQHTLEHYRELFMPRLWDRGFWTDGETEHRKDLEIVEKADAKWREVLAGAGEPHVNGEMVERVRQVVARAQRDLCR